LIQGNSDLDIPDLSEYQTINAETAIDYISSLTDGKYLISITGEITKEQVNEIGNVMRTNSKPEIYLDLSKTTGLISLKDASFYEVENLFSITMPAGLESLGNSTFCNCVRLKYAVLNDDLQHIGNFAFAITKKNTNSSLRRVNIPSTVNWIGMCAFQMAYKPAIEIASVQGWYYTDNYTNFAYRKGGEKIEKLTSVNLERGIPVENDTAIIYKPYYFYKQ
jgi:hypothetical protein